MVRQIEVYGHRGARALFPENTLHGFTSAAALGVQAFELDVGMTADGVVVVSHDTALNPEITRYPSGAWLAEPGPTIYSLTYGELRRYDVGRIRPNSRTSALFPNQVSHDGACIPTLSVVLAALPSSRFLIEVKTDPNHPGWTAPPHVLTDAVLSVIDAANAGARMIIEAFDWRVPRLVRRARPEFKLAWLTRSETLSNPALWLGDGTPVGSVPARVAAEAGPIWAPSYTGLTEAQIQEAHALGLAVIPWTVNDAADVQRLIQWDVDGLISDRPDLVVTQTASQGP